MNPRHLVAVLGLTLASAAVLSADTRIEFKATEGGGSGLTTILIGSGKVRSALDANTAVIIDPAAGTLTTIDHKQKTFTTLTRADIEQMGKMMGDAAKKMEEAMAGMPPDMREKMMAMRGGGMPGMPASTTVDTGERATVAGRSCRIFRTSSGGQVIAENCLADPALFDMPAADRATLNATMAFLKEFTEKLAQGPLAAIGNSTPFRAGLVPVRTTTISGGTRQTSELVSVSATAVPADQLSVPAGYKEQKLQMPGRGRGGK